MKGFVFVSALLGILLPLKSLYAKWAAKKDPVDIKALKKTRFPGSDGY